MFKIHFNSFFYCVITGIESDRLSSKFTQIYVELMRKTQNTSNSKIMRGSIVSNLMINEMSWKKQFVLKKK